MIDTETILSNGNFIDEVKELQREIDKESKPNNPFVELGNIKKEGYDLSKSIQQTYLFNQPGPFELEWGFIPEGIVSMLVSPGGCGKTYALMQAAVSGATGLKWFNTFRPNRSFKTLLILAEENRVFAHNRLKHIVDCLEISKNPEYLEKVYQNIHMLPLSGGLHRFTDSGGKTTDSLLYLKEYLESNPEIKLVVLDPASRFLGPNCELDNAAATDWVAALNELTQIKNAPTIIASHHANKSALRPIKGSKEVVFDQSITRGASGLVDGVRLVLGMQKKENNNEYSILFKIFKTNVCDAGAAIELIADKKFGGVLRLKNKEESFKPKFPAPIIQRDFEDGSYE